MVLVLSEGFRFKFRQQGLRFKFPNKLPQIKTHMKTQIVEFPMYVTDERGSTTEFASLNKVRHNSRQLVRFIEDLARPLVNHLQ